MGELVEIKLVPNARGILSKKDRDYVRKLFDTVVSISPNLFTEATCQKRSRTSRDRVARVLCQSEEKSFEITLEIIPEGFAKITGEFRDGQDTISLETETFFKMRGLVGFYESLARIAREKAKIDEERAAETRRKTLWVVGKAGRLYSSR